MGFWSFITGKNKQDSNLEFNINITAPTPSYEEFEVTPIEERIKGEKPCFDGLYAHEVLVLSYAPKFFTKDNNFQGFWWSQYGISDVQSILNSLYERGFIQLGTIESQLNSITTPAIKDLLKQHGLKVSGSKSDLIARAIEKIPPSEILKQFDKRTYMLTDLGTEVLNKYYWIPILHRHPIRDVSSSEIIRIISNNPEKKLSDLFICYIESNSAKYSKGQLGLYRNSRYQIFVFLDDIKEYAQAFEYLCDVVVYDICEYNNASDFWWRSKDLLRIWADFYFNNDYEPVIAPAIQSDFNNYLEDLFNNNYNDFKNALAVHCKKMQLPFYIYTNEELVEMMLFYLNGDTQSMINVKKQSKNRFYRQNKL